MNAKTEANLSHRRTKWLELAKKVTTTCLARLDWLNDLRPERRLDDAERREALKTVCTHNREIGKMTEEMDALESRTLGIVTVISNPTPITGLVVTLLTMARLNAAANSELNLVEEVVALAGAGDAEDALAARNLFRSDSALRPHLHISYRSSLDESEVRLKESSLNRILGNSPGDGSEEMTRAYAITKTWK